MTSERTHHAELEIPLPDALRNSYRGNLPGEAGLELLIRSNLVGTRRSPWIRINGKDRAIIDLNALLDASGAWSGGEQRVIRIAVSLLDGDTKVPLNDVIPGLDRNNLRLVLAAVAHAAGSHQDADIVIQEDGRHAKLITLDSLYPWPDPVNTRH